ncbi:hypothetical protein AMR42_12160 [Limnothrix sp. PR1529]|uniref:hypothetical protein n=1 Tax=Limnothrix sp. PR1529 TaxID=1704291 RepID=UPI00081D94B8|nr:hypothetical protein [Limnothrix sp. PR1529]OCQ94864.1 hypothetical protein BCR12_14785 [Limnothrix sp. P13C2]PIB09842.1 hypothetical protein AMR42_12160 [Limnothrix sp. PR1529]
MDYLKADITNKANWSNVWSANLEAARITPGVFEPIPDVVVPGNLSSPLVIVGCFCPPDAVKPTWSHAGTIQVSCDLNLFGGLPLSRSIFANYSAQINRSRLVSIPRIVSNYQLFFRPAKWIPKIEVGVFEYIGESSDEIINELRSLQDIEALQNTAIEEIQLTQSEILAKL